MKASFGLGVFVREQAARLKEIRDAPGAVAGGAAIGIFWGFTPLLGLKTLLSILCAWLTRCSKVSAAIAVSFHDILTPVWPVFLRWEYEIGFWMLSHPHHFPERLSLAHAHLRSWFHFRTVELLWPLLVGSMVFSIPGSFLTYWIVKAFVRRG